MNHVTCNSSKRAQQVDTAPFRRLPTISESDISAEDRPELDKVDPTTGSINKKQTAGQEPEPAMERDEQLREQLNLIAIKMDLHKNGVLYLREAVILVLIRK